jgi:hypothetical protein
VLGATVAFRVTLGAPNVAVALEAAVVVLALAVKVTVKSFWPPPNTCEHVALFRLQLVKLPLALLQAAKNDVPPGAAVTVTVVLLSLLERVVHVPLIVTAGVLFPIPLAGGVSQRLLPVVANDTEPEVGLICTWPLPVPANVILMLRAAA